MCSNDIMPICCFVCIHRPKEITLICFTLLVMRLNGELQKGRIHTAGLDAQF